MPDGQRDILPYIKRRLAGRGCRANKVGRKPSQHAANLVIAGEWSSAVPWFGLSVAKPDGFRGAESIQSAR